MATPTNADRIVRVYQDKLSAAMGQLNAAVLEAKRAESKWGGATTAKIFKKDLSIAEKAYSDFLKSR